METQTKELSTFLKWVEENTHFFTDKDVTIKQVVGQYASQLKPLETLSKGVSDEQIKEQLRITILNEYIKGVGKDNAEQEYKEGFQHFESTVVNVFRSLFSSKEAFSSKLIDLGTGYFAHTEDDGFTIDCMKVLRDGESIMVTKKNGELFMGDMRPSSKEVKCGFEEWLEKEIKEHEHWKEQSLGDAKRAYVVSIDILNNVLSEYKKLSPSIEKEGVTETDIETMAKKLYPEDLYHNGEYVFCGQGIKLGLSLQDRREKWISVGSTTKMPEEKTKVLMEGSYYPMEGFFINGKCVFPEKYQIAPPVVEEKK